MIASMKRSLFSALIPSALGLALAVSAAAFTAHAKETVAAPPVYDEETAAAPSVYAEETILPAHAGKPPSSAYATEETPSAYSGGMPPHLIQTVTERDLYEGMIALGFLETPVLETEDCKKAYENVKSCVVRLQMGKAHGSGIIWAFHPQSMVIATNRHVLDYWKDENSYVYFDQGYYADARIMGVSEHYDVGFLTIDNGQFTYEELKAFRSARIDEAHCDRLQCPTAVFSVEPASAADDGTYYEAVLEETGKYIADFEADMLYGHGFARSGMSGGGIFDGRGYLIGMTTGGTLQNEVAGVPLSDIVWSYEEVYAIK